MSIDPRRLLGLAFASADLLVELRDGQVRLVLGAAQRIMGRSEAALTGATWTSLFHPDDRPLMASILASADDGQRRGPIVLRLADDETRHVGVILRAPCTSCDYRQRFGPAAERSQMHRRQ